MRRLIKFCSLPPRQQALLMRALLLVATMRVGLWVAPFAAMRRMAIRRSAVRGNLSSRLQASRSGAGGAARATFAGQRHCSCPSPEQLAEVVRRAAEYIPAATCLTQALAAQVLLGQEGYASDLRIGVNLMQGKRLTAHAWVEHDGRVIVGAVPGMSEFTPLPAL